jgi:Zn-finger nucleic acid-binding protein
MRDDPERAALVCDACHGVFVDYAVLAASVDAERPVDSPAPVAPSPSAPSSRPLGASSRSPAGSRRRLGDARYGWCPHCGQVMTPMVFGQRSGIVVDVCREHGTWFDRGELDAVLAFVRAGHFEQDLAAAAPAIDRALEAKLTVAVLGETQREVQRTKDLAHVLLSSGHVWRAFLR